MSREFGSPDGGYFHHKLSAAHEDAKGGRLPITLAWADVIEQIAEVAYAISSAEACDSGEDYPTKESFDRLRAVQGALGRISSMVDIVGRERADVAHACLGPELKPFWQEYGQRIRIRYDWSLVDRLKKVFRDEDQAYDAFSRLRQRVVDDFARAEKAPGWWRCGSSGYDGSLAYAEWTNNNDDRVALANDARARVEKALRRSADGDLSPLETVAEIADIMAKWRRLERGEPA